VDVRPLTEKPPLEGYDCVLLGRAIQGGNLLPEALDFIRGNREALQKIPGALFIVHFFFRSQREPDVKMRQTYLDGVRPLLPETPVVFFAGRFDRRTTAAGLPQWLANLTPTIDRRDWGKIRAWAETVFAQPVKN
jgi:menaquinone-dependent protoporphyrinogen IX oxidase